MGRLDVAAGAYHSAATSGPLRRKFYEKVPLWESAPHFQSVTTNPVENTPRVTGQSGTSDNIAVFRQEIKNAFPPLSARRRCREGSKT